MKMLDDYYHEILQPMAWSAERLSEMCAAAIKKEQAAYDYQSDVYLSYQAPGDKNYRMARNRAINEAVKQEHNMTREEAIKKVIGLPWNSPDGIVTTLEALGLIKFDDPVKDNGAANCIGFSFSQIAKAYIGGDLTAVGYAIIQDLEKSGYQIVKLGKNTTVKMDSSVLVEYNKFNGKLVEIEQ